MKGEANLFLLNIQSAKISEAKSVISAQFLSLYKKTWGNLQSA